jgi:hypothetical protein
MDDSAGLLSTASAKDELVKLATRLIVEEVLEGKAGDAVGRDYYSTGPSGSPRTQVGNLAFLPPRTLRVGLILSAPKREDVGAQRVAQPSPARWRQHGTPFSD